MKCEYCIYFSRFGDGVVGECRMNPPIVVMSLSDAYDRGESRWPQVTQDNWCGQFRAKKENPLKGIPPFTLLTPMEK